VLLVTVLGVRGSFAGDYLFSVAGDQILLNSKPFKIIGLRCSNALVSDVKTQELIDQLEVYRSYGINTVSVFFMGSRFGDIKGYRVDASLNPILTERMGRIIEAADRLGMVVLIGCLYWSTSKAKEELVDVWGQDEANQAIANTVRWLVDHDYRNVFVDVDNEGMAHDQMGWNIGEMIEAAHSVDVSIMVAYNDKDPAPSNADLYIHHSPKVRGEPWLESEGTPKSAPGGYWGTYSKDTHRASDDGYYNYSRIGRYTTQMKQDDYRQTDENVGSYNGHMLASTWLQCAPAEGVGGPFTRPGGHSRIENVDLDIDQLHPDAGILWWLEYVKRRYGPWVPPK
jgi:hypothetical protein